MKTLKVLLFAAFLLLPGVAFGQCSFPTGIQANAVVGRLGIGTGPCQAIPFSVLSANLTGAQTTLNSGNGQTAPGAMAPGNTYSFGAITDTPRMTGLGLGGAAPATGLEIYNAPVAPGSNGQGVFGAAAVNGGEVGGQGSTYDVALINKNAALALAVPTGTQNVVLQGTLTASSLSTVGTIAGSLCATSGGLILYEAAVNCFAVSGITVVSGKTLTIDNTLELAGTDGTKFTFPATTGTVGTLEAAQTVSGNKTFSGTLNITGTGQINGTAFGTFATQNFATPPAIGGTTPAAGSFSTLTATTPVSLTSGGTNASTAAGARASGGLNVDELTAHGDSNYAILSTDRVVATSATLTTPRTWTLPAASSVNAGQTLFIQDFKGFVSGTNTLTIPRNGSDTINGGTGSQVINTSNGGFLFISDGVSNWSAQALGAQATSGVASINGQTGSPSVVAGNGISVSTTGGNISVAANNYAAGNNTWTGANLFRSGQPWCDVRAEGAVGDGTTDDTAAFNACKTLCLASYGACIIFVPPSGNAYCLKSGFYVNTGVTTNGGIILKGAGVQGSVLSACGQNIIVVRSNNQWFTIEDMTIYGYGAFASDPVFSAAPVAPTVQCDQSNGTFFRMHNVYVTAGTAAIELQCSNYVLDAVATYGSYGDGTHVKGMITTINGGGWITNSHFDQTFPICQPAHNTTISAWASTHAYSTATCTTVSVTCNGRSWYIQLQTSGTSGGTSPPCLPYRAAITDGTAVWQLVSPVDWYCAQFDTGSIEVGVVNTDFTCAANYNIGFTNTFSSTAPTQMHFGPGVTPGSGISGNVNIAAGSQFTFTGLETSYCLLSGCAGVVINGGSVVNINGLTCLNSFTNCINLVSGTHVSAMQVMSIGGDSADFNVAANVSSFKFTDSIHVSGAGNLFTVASGTSDHYIIDNNICNTTSPISSDGGSGTHKIVTLCGGTTP